MKKIVSINKNKEFKRVYLKGAYMSSPVLVTYILKNRLGVNRFGITAGKKTGNAVKRNRSKRIIRASFSMLKEKLRVGYDFIFVSRQKTPSSNTADVFRDMLYHLKKLGVLK